MSKKQCCRCGGKAESTWSCCALGGKKLWLCKGCDFLLNALAMEFAGIKNKKDALWEYAMKSLRP